LLLKLNVCNMYVDCESRLLNRLQMFFLSRRTFTVTQLGGKRIVCSLVRNRLVEFWSWIVNYEVISIWILRVQNVVVNVMNANKLAQFFLPVVNLLFSCLGFQVLRCNLLRVKNASIKLKFLLDKKWNCVSFVMKLIFL